MRATRRTVLAGAGAALAAQALGAAAVGALSKPVPATGELIPAVGLGSWITFNVGDGPAAARRMPRRDGRLLRGRRRHDRFVAHVRVLARGDWRCVRETRPPVGTLLGRQGLDPCGGSARAQIAETARRWGVGHFDLLQVHNLIDWEANLDTLAAMKEAGALRYTGVTTSHGRRHAELEDVMRRHPPDFVQFTYNIVDREAERRLLPLARERDIAVICNRPFQRGRLPDRLAGRRMPGWAEEIGVSTWPQFLLKFILSHPAVTTAIPATRRVDHLIENKSAAFGPMPDAAMRQTHGGACARPLARRGLDSRPP